MVLVYYISNSISVVFDIEVKDEKAFLEYARVKHHRPCAQWHHDQKTKVTVIMKLKVFSGRVARQTDSCKISRRNYEKNIKLHS